MKLYKIAIIIVIIGLIYWMYQSLFLYKLNQVKRCESMGGVYHSISVEEYVCFDQKVVLYKGK